MNNSSTAKKPFPWKCSECKQKAVREAIVDYTTQMQHDGREYTVHVDGLKTPQCENCGLVHPDSDAMRAITLAFLRQANLLTPAQIREHRRKSKLTQVELAAALGVAEATLSRWETGAQIQQRSLDNLLRLFFGIARVRKILTTQQISTLANSPA
jgi:putative zinc finger/helix-turn-helix YgiT family protein